MVRRGKVRRAKLYYLRGRTGKAARIQERAADRRQTAQGPEGLDRRRRSRRPPAAASRRRP